MRVLTLLVLTWRRASSRLSPHSRAATRLCLRACVDSYVVDVMSCFALRPSGVTAAGVRGSVRARPQDFLMGDEGLVCAWIWHSF